MLSYVVPSFTGAQTMISFTAVQSCPPVRCLEEHDMLCKSHSGGGDNIRSLQHCGVLCYRR